MINSIDAFKTSSLDQGFAENGCFGSVPVVHCYDRNRPEADLIGWLGLAENKMIALKILTLIFVIVFGIPNQIIDYKHRKLYEPGHAWGYYAKLSKDGNWEGRFMMWSAYIGIYFIFGALAYTFYLLVQSK